MVAATSSLRRAEERINISGGSLGIRYRACPHIPIYGQSDPADHKLQGAVVNHLHLNAGSFGTNFLGATLSDCPVIVTGASGRVGRILSRILTSEAAPGLAFHWASRRPSDGGSGQIRWDIGADAAPDWQAGAVLLHLAGSTGANQPELNPALIAPVLAACQRNAVRHLVFISTAAVCAPGPTPARESDPPRPANPYGAAKLEAERLLAARHDRALPVTILRLGNLAGADALLAPRPPGAPAIRLDPVPGEAPETGAGPLRSWIGPFTFARTLVALLQRIARGQPLPGVINLAQPPALGMAALLRVSGLAWDWGPPNPALVPAAMLDSGLLEGLVPVPAATPRQIIAERAALQRLFGA